MNKRILLVVGDKFYPYVQGKDAITASQLQGLLSLPVQFLPSAERTLLVPGQGLGDDRVRDLLAAASTSANVQHFDFSLWHSLPRRASGALTHKHREENVLISAPRQLAEHEYEMHLLIDERCELMSDHQSGQHVQGMILVEASRQMTIAVTESFLLPEGRESKDYAFVLNQMSVSYNNFTFPIGAIIRCRMVSQDVANPRRLSFVMDATVEQCGCCVASFTFSIAAMDRAVVGKKENMQSQRAQENYLALVLAQAHQQQAVVTRAGAV